LNADDGLFAEHSTPTARTISRLPPAPQQAMGWTDYLAAAWRNWWIVLLALVVGIVGAVAATSAGGKSYTSETLVAVAPAPGLPLTATMSEIKPEKVATAAELLAGDQMMERAGQSAGVDKSDADRYTATGTPSLRGSTVDVVVTGPDADTASKLSGALVTIVGQEYAKLYPGYTINAVDGPTAASAPSGPSRTVEIAVGVVVGLGLGLLLAVARESARRTRA